ncbi:M48 family metallopeptidase [Picosynechococcus sp. PCC 11901]|uniref:M48 family metallopeptidase n=1 Tax=Picosynechococcus sp. PCC 11901 TaxID=2579791 RepID=UPI0010FBD1B2|nr:M48 family metallopeptidase [Picosynechococcus sp. PCC 11901]QCS50839.1 M48 family metallopeptidase [Picosynechococcus sp. PCC 11901]
MIGVKHYFTGLTADQFRHPLDQEATAALRRLPGLDLLVRSFLGSTAEQVFQFNNLASSILVGDRQLPHLHHLLQEAAQVLDLTPPDLYIQQNPVPNAYTFAMRGQKPFMVIHTALVEILTEAELQAVMAHELGHLKCEHGVYLTLANLLMLATNALPVWGSLLSQSLQNQMLAWLRCAELSCDRAAFLVSQDPKIMMSVLMKLAGGSPSLAPLLNLDAFMEQAKTYEHLSQNRLGQLLQETQTTQLTHPLPVVRAQEIWRWASSQEYSLLLQNRDSVYNHEGSSKGGWRNW